MNRFFRCLVILAFAGLIAAVPLHAVTVNWNLSTGNFNDGASWDTGAIPGVGDTVNIQNAGVATLSDAFPNTIGYLRVGSATTTGSLVLDTNAVLNCANSNYTIVESPAGGLSTLTIKDNARLNFAGSYLLLSVNSAGSRATMTVQDNAVVDLPASQVGCASGGSGAIYQTGGTIQNSVGVNRGHYFGMNTVDDYGYFGMSGGEFVDNGNNEFAFGYYGMGIFNQSGGSVTFGRSMRLGGSGTSYGEYNMTGGTADYCAINWNSHVGIGGTGVMSISGGTMTYHTTTYLGYYGGNGTINLGIAGSPGGTLAVTDLYKSTGSGVVNFHGGMLKVVTSSQNADFLKYTTNYVWGEGAILDTAGNNATITSGFLVPEGNGVLNIGLATSGDGYIGAPAVRISGGGGSGATAVANFDKATGTVTGITITNPGTGYLDPTSLVVTLVGGGAVTPATIDTNSFALNSGNVCGGLTKTGLGTLTLSTENSTYTGPTTVQQGTLVMNNISLASSSIVVKSAGTLAGNSAMIVYPVTTVESGGTIAPGTLGGYLFLDELNLENNSKLKFAFDISGSSDSINVDGNVTAVGGSPITVQVNYSGAIQYETPVLSVSGNLDTNITFALPNPVLDSADAINTSGAWLTTVHGTGGSVTLNPGGVIPDPAWSNSGGGSWSNNGNWGSGPYPNGGDKRAMFIQSLGGPVSVTLDVSPQLSSMIFKSPGGESYTITPSGGNFITMHSTIATDWHISVLGGEHAVAADIKMAAGTGQSIIRLADDSHLTLSGVLSNETTATGVNFAGNYGNGIGTGVLTLSGANTYTGPTVIRSGVLEVTGLSDAGVAGPLGAATADPANLVLGGGLLRYAGATPASTNRGLTIATTSGISTLQDATISGQITAAVQFGNFTKYGKGGLTLSNTANDLTFRNLIVDEGTLTLQGTSGAKPAYRVNDNQWGDMIIGANSHAAALTLTNANLGFASGNMYVGAGVGVSGTATIQDGANITSAGAFWLEIGNGGGMGVLNQTGGSIQVGQLTEIANGGASWGVYNMSGGVADINSTGWSLNIGVSGSGTGVLNISGTAQIKTSVVLLGVYDTGAGILNLGAVGSGGGTLSLPAVGSYSASPTTSTGYFNFHGGVLQATADSATFMNAYADLDGIYVYEEGAKIDSNGHDITVASALLVPTDDGVKSIAVADAGSGYTGEPIVQISGGTGKGATARAVMAGDHIDHIEITNPGTGYLSGDVLTVNIVGGLASGGTAATAGTVTLDANDATGGLTKLGDGTLTLSGGQAYLGDTFVNEGTLTITTPLVTPAASVSVATGATLNAVSIEADSLNIGVTPLPGPGTGTASVPEPGTMLLLVMGGLALAGAYLRRK